MSAPPGNRSQPPDENRELFELFGQALDLPESDRSGFLDTACEGKPRLRAQVEELLRQDKALGGSQDTQGDSGPLYESRTIQRTKGDQIGDYILDRRLGVGGMGEVWKAEQKSLSRHVALKLLLPGRGSERAVEKFKREGQALALLNHPGIVAVYDMDQDEEGQHWISMEYIPGGRTLRDVITAALGAPDLGTKRFHVAAKIVSDVAHALASAHARQVIHRDLKPSNILIDELNRPRVVDFGLARMTTEEQLTVSGEIAGTYAYMSPEQVRARPSLIGAKTDMFSLGIILYEILCLRRPFEGDTVHQVAQKILSEDPPDPRRVLSQIPNDLVTITGKALEKKQDRRYPSMQAFADDLDRFLKGELIHARPPTRLQRLTRYIQLHPTRSAVSAVGVTSFSVISLLLMQNMATNTELRTERGNLKRSNADLIAKTEEATENAEEAQRRERIASEVNRFLNEDLFKAVAPSVEAGKGKDITMREVLDEASKRIEGRFPDEPLVEAAIRQTLGETYLALGEAARAQSHLAGAQTAYSFHLGPDSVEVALATNATGRSHEELGDYTAAQADYERALEISRAALGNNHETSLAIMSNLGLVLDAQGDAEAARPLLVECLDLSRRILGPDHADTMSSANNLGFHYVACGEIDRASEFIYEALEIAERTLGREHPDTLTALNNVGSLLQRQGHDDEALEYLQDALVIGRRVIGDKHPLTIERLTNLGLLQKDLGHLDVARDLCKEALDASVEVLGGEHPTTLVCINNLGAVAAERGENAEAERLMRWALDHSRMALGNEHPDTLISIYNVGVLLEKAEDYERSAPLFEECYQTALRTRGEEDYITQAALRHLLAVQEKL